MDLEELLDDEETHNRENCRPDVCHQIRRSIAQVMVANFTNAQVQSVSSFVAWILPWAFKN